MAYYRFICGDIGIYEAVERDCPRGDARRGGKPDGSWLPRVGAAYPGAVSFWTEQGLARYRDSGLMAWHAAVVATEVGVLVCEGVGQVLYRDEYQVIARPEELAPTRRVGLGDL